MTRISVVLTIVAFVGISSLVAQERGRGAGQQQTAPQPGRGGAQQPGRGNSGFGATQEGVPPLLFKEEFQQVDSAAGTPSSPRHNPENKYYLATQSAVKNPNVELKLYGPDVKNLVLFQHEGRVDLWTGLVGAPIAILVKHRNSFLDLTGLARVRVIARTGNLHRLNPAIRLADGTLAAGDRSIDTNGQFSQNEISFPGQRWYVIEPDTLAVKAPVQMIDLAKVDEVGVVDLAPAGGHQSAGYVNVSHIEVYAKPVPR
jgi:hypothetical protein